MNRTKRSIALFSALLITVFIVITASFNTVHDANATGGAFPYTKHGGGTTDGVTPYDRGNGPGVDRAVNTDYVTHYNSEAGKYKGGECTQCHEPHASFGGLEAPPSTGGDAGPDAYLALKDYGSTTNYANLCWYCHENFSNINSSGSPLRMGRWSFYQGMTTYMASSHYSPPAGSFYWPGDGSASPIWPRKNRSGLPNGNMGSCLNCHTPHGIKSADAASAYDTTSPDGTGGVPASMQTVASGNLSVNADYLIPRQLIAWEETLCERCHDASGPSSKNIQDEINKRVTGSGHSVDDTTLAGKHVASESLPITTKHVECYDCHNPHAVSSTNRVEGMKFVDIGGTVQDPATGPRQPYVYEICLKCHGNSFNTFIPSDKAATGTGAEANGTLRTTVAQYGCSNINPASSCTNGSNKRLEFDTATNSADGFVGGTLAGNRAYHPVAEAGRNTSPTLTNQLLGGLTTASTINCTDCHNNEMTGAGTFTGLTATPTYPGPVTQSNLMVRGTDVASAYTGASPVGPHGSSNVRLLRANYNTSLGTTSAAPFASFDSANFALCFNCHNVNAFTDDDGIVLGVQMTNFRQSPAGVSTKINLHATHLTDVSGGGGWDYLTNMFTSCANCHYNVHSNAEATNTQYGTATGAGLPLDGDTHLVNFSPIVKPLSFTKPRWWYINDIDYGPIMRCNLTCHGVDMGLSPLDAWYRYYGS